MNITLLQYLGMCVVVFYIVTGRYIYCCIKYGYYGFYSKLYRSDVFVLMIFMLTAILIDKYL